jgi:hypothetical protein
MTDDRARTAVLVLAAIAIGFALVQTIRLWWVGASARWRLAARALHARDGEARADGLLARLGYEIVARQAFQPWTVRIDGAPLRVSLRADYVVTRAGRSFVAEVKTGREAPRVESAATRRQLLEYRLAFAVDGVLLVDVDAERVQEIEFALPGDATEPAGARAARLRGMLVVLLIGVALGAAAAVALLRTLSPS